MASNKESSEKVKDGQAGQQSFDAHREPPDIVLALVLALALKRKARTAGAGVSTEMLWGQLALRPLGIVMLGTYVAVGTGAGVGQLDMVGGRLALRRLVDDWR